MANNTTEENEMCNRGTKNQIIFGEIIGSVVSGIVGGLVGITNVIGQGIVLNVCFPLRLLWGFVGYQIRKELINEVVNRFRQSKEQEIIQKLDIDYDQLILKRMISQITNFKNSRSIKFNHLM